MTIKIYIFKFSAGNPLVIRTNKGYINDAIRELFTTSLDRKKYDKKRVVKFIINIITEDFILIICLISSAKPCVPPVTKFKGFNIKLKLREAIKINIAK